MNEPIIDLSNCAREPIHIPGAIQPHGVLFVLDDVTLAILQVSSNTEGFLGKVPEDLLGRGLEAFLTPAEVDRVRFALSSSDINENNPVQLGLTAKHEGTPLDGIVHRHDGFSILELEASTPPNGSYFLDFYRSVSRTTSRLQSATTLEALVAEAAAGVRQITGFDRVMIYRFAESGEGEVIAESRAEAASSFLGLWYPASDIPEQARRLYTLSPIRGIPDINYVPVPLVPVINPASQRPADLSFSGLRSVSSIHCEYLRNMGVTASMSISIVRDGKLWGLVACHHLSPKRVAYEMRKSCTFLGQVLSGEITRREIEEESAYTMRATEIRAQFLELMAAANKPLMGLIDARPNLLDLIPADGAAVVSDGNIRTLGTTPGYEEILTIAASLPKINAPGTFVTQSLRNHLVAGESMKESGSGLIALEISRLPQRYLMFFRPEMPQTITWGGNPEKPVIATDDGYRLGPRRSFAQWQETLYGVAKPWTRDEVRAATELRKLILVVLMKDTAVAS